MANVIYDALASEDNESDLKVVLICGTDPRREIALAPDKTVRDLKLQAYPDAVKTRNVRFIHCGQMYLGALLISRFAQRWVQA
jgi:hypothetical protein